VGQTRLSKRAEMLQRESEQDQRELDKSRTRTTLQVCTNA
jgi:hypothetical protein